MHRIKSADLDRDAITPPIVLAATTESQLSAMVALRGVRATAIVDAARRTILTKTTADTGFDLETAVDEIVDGVAGQLYASTMAGRSSIGIDEIRVVERDVHHLVRPLDDRRRTLLYVAVDATQASPSRTIRRLAKYIGALMA